MTQPSHEVAPELRILWPIEALNAIFQEAGKRTALVIVMEHGVLDFTQRFLVSGLAIRLVQSGVELFALVGKEAEQAHDSLDQVLEEAGEEKVVTSWHDESDPEDAASFVVASARATDLSRVVAVIDESRQSSARLKKCIVKAIRTGSLG